MSVFMQLYAPGVNLTLYGESQYGRKSAYCLLTREWIEGWYDTPDLKVTLTERGQGDGAHDVADDSVLYSARTVTVHAGIVADSRELLLRQLRQVMMLAHRTVTVRLVDDESDTFIKGQVTVKAETVRDERSLPFTLTIVASRPERLAWDPYRVQISAAATGDTGLQYGSGASGLEYPLAYGVRATDARNVATLINNGSSRAYPTFTVTGSFTSGVMIDFPGTGGYLYYTQPVGNTPLVLDSRSRTATMAGLDVTRNLSVRGFPVVEPYQSISAVLLSGGSGWVTCEVRDTYM